MRETPFFFARGEARLFGVLHLPDGQAPRTGYVCCHPFAEEKLWSHRVFVSLARALAARGHAVLRFDFTGAGDSSGTTLDTSVETHLADLVAAIHELKARAPSVERVGFVGLRLGAAFAALGAERAAEGAFPSGVSSGPLVLWEPVLDGAAYLQDIMRSNLSGQLAFFGKVVETREEMQAKVMAGGAISIDGYEIARGLFESCNRADLVPATPKRHAGPTLIMPIVPARKQKPRPDLDALAASYGRAEVLAADEQPFWREVKQYYGRAPQLEAATLEWLERADG
jgi:exosortase A-associated hydrolase 2